MRHTGRTHENTRTGGSRTRLVIGVALCAALFVFVGCPDGGGPSGGGGPGGTPDTTPPVITLMGDAEITLEVGNSFTDPGATVTDDDPDYAGAITITSIDGDGNEAFVSLLTNAVSAVTYTVTYAVGVYTITYTAEADAAGREPEPVTRTVTVQDTTDPMITLLGGNTLLVAVGNIFTDPGATVADNDPAYGSRMATAVVTDSANAPLVGAIDTTVLGTTYTITYTADADASNNAPATITRPVRVVTAIDSDADLLIDINTIEELNAIRHNLAGTSYRESAHGGELLCGADGTTACIGYELMRDLDFTDAWMYASGEVNANYIPNNANPSRATNNGWEPIGTYRSRFSGMLVGNGFTISNLYTRRYGFVGFFGVSGGTIKDIGMVDGNVYGRGLNAIVGGLVGENTGAIITSYTTGGVYGSGREDYMGGLVGANKGAITESYATGNIDGAGGSDTVGGLVGFNTLSSGIITASYATGDVTGGDARDTVGGLVGDSGEGSAIIASYATGDVTGGAGGPDIVGGFVGSNIYSATITTSYATGDVTGGDWEGESVGGFVGNNAVSSTITASYATGDVKGGAGERYFIGGFVGNNAISGVIIASYSIGDADGSAGIRNWVGSLIARHGRDTRDGRATHTASYGFGSTAGNAAGSLPVTRSGDATSLANPCAITEANSSRTQSNRWDPTQWDFGTTTQRPFVRHNGAMVPGQTDRNNC